MQKYTQEEYLQFAINYLNERDILKIEQGHKIAIMDLPSSVKWDIVNAYMARDKELLTNLIKTNINI